MRLSLPVVVSLHHHPLLLLLHHHHLLVLLLHGHGARLRLTHQVHISSVFLLHLALRLSVLDVLNQCPFVPGNEASSDAVAQQADSQKQNSSTAAGGEPLFSIVLPDEMDSVQRIVLNKSQIWFMVHNPLLISPA